MKLPYFVWLLACPVGRIGHTAINVINTLTQICCCYYPLCHNDSFILHCFLPLLCVIITYCVSSLPTVCHHYLLCVITYCTCVSSFPRVCTTVCNHHLYCVLSFVTLLPSVYVLVISQQTGGCAQIMLLSGEHGRHIGGGH